MFGKTVFGKTMFAQQSGVAASDEEVAAATETVLSLPTFRRLPASVKSTLRRQLTVERFEQDGLLLRQGDSNPGVLHIVVEGMVESRHKALATYMEVEPTVAMHQAGEMLGHFSMLSNEPVRVSATAQEGALIARLDLSDQGAAGVRAAREALQRPLADYTSAYARDSGHLESELHTMRLRMGAAVPLVATLAMMSLYTLTLSLAPSLQDLLPVNFIYTPILIVLFSFISWIAIRASKIDKAMFGICNKRLGADIVFAVVSSALLLGALFGAKAWAIENVPELEGMTLFTPADIEVHWGGLGQTEALFFAIALYAFFAPFQELVARCGIQAPLQALLDHQGRRFAKGMRVFMAIFVANLVFAAAHAHLSLEFALAAALPGFFWGFVFWWTNSLWAVSISHVLVGGAGLFLLGVEQILQRMSWI